MWICHVSNKWTPESKWSWNLYFPKFMAEFRVLTSISGQPFSTHWNPGAECLGSIQMIQSGLVKKSTRFLYFLHVSTFVWTFLTLLAVGRKWYNFRMAGELLYAYCGLAVSPPKAPIDQCTRDTLAEFHAVVKPVCNNFRGGWWIIFLNIISGWMHATEFCAASMPWISMSRPKAHRKVG